MGIITFNGIASDTLGIVVERPPVYTYPKREYSVFHVLGRNGDIVMDNGSYQNVTRSYDIAIGSKEEDFTPQANRISKWLHSADAIGYARLEDSYEPEYVRLAFYEEETDIENILQHMGRVTINFNCKPQRFLKNGEQILTYYPSTTTNYITNPTSYDAKPFIRLRYSGGTNRIIVGDSVFTFIYPEDASGIRDLCIDCETEEIYFDLYNVKVDARAFVRYNVFPVLKANSRTRIATTYDDVSNFMRMDITPYWWII